MTNQRAQEFIAANLPVLCQETATWLATGWLHGGYTKQLVMMLGPVTDPLVHEQAKGMIVRAALQMTAELPGKYGKLKADHDQTTKELGRVSHEHGMLKKSMRKPDAPRAARAKPQGSPHPPDSPPPTSTPPNEPTPSL